MTQLRVKTTCLFLQCINVSYFYSVICDMSKTGTHGIHESMHQYCDGLY